MTAIANSGHAPLLRNTVWKARPKVFKQLARELELVENAQKWKLLEMKRRGWAALDREVGDHAKETGH